MPLLKLGPYITARTGIPFQTLRFFFDGLRLQPDDTAESLDFEDNDMIDMMKEMLAD